MTQIPTRVVALAVHLAEQGTPVALHALSILERAYPGLATLLSHILG